MCCGRKKPTNNLKRTKSGLKKKVQPPLEEPKPILPKDSNLPTTPPYGVQ